VVSGGHTGLIYQGVSTVSATKERWKPLDAGGDHGDTQILVETTETSDTGGEHGVSQVETREATNPWYPSVSISLSRDCWRPLDTSGCTETPWPR